MTDVFGTLHFLCFPLPHRYARCSLTGQPEFYDWQMLLRILINKTLDALDEIRYEKGKAPLTGSRMYQTFSNTQCPFVIHPLTDGRERVCICFICFYVPTCAHLPWDTSP